MLALLIRHHVGSPKDLPDVLCQFQQNLTARSITTIKDVSFVESVSEGTDLDAMLQGLRDNGFEIIIVVERNRGGAEIILHPTEEHRYENELIDVAAGNLQVFYKTRRQLERENLRKKKLAEKKSKPKRHPQQEPARKT